MNNQSLIKKLIEAFQDRQKISRTEIAAFLGGLEVPQLDEDYLGWILFNLRKKNRLELIDHEEYRMIKRKPVFIPEINKTLKQIHASVHTNNGPEKYCLWDTAWLNEFLELQALNTMIILEVQKEFTDYTFHKLRDEGFNNVFLKPEASVIERYISENERSIVIKPLISRSPIKNVQSLPIASLEKILVDIFCEPELFTAYQGRQMIKIVAAADEKYRLNFDKMRSYAKRRHREDELFRMIHDQIDFPLDNM